MKKLLRKLILTASLAMSMLTPGIGSAQMFSTGPAPVPPLVSPVQIGEARKVHLILTGLVTENDIGPMCKQDVLAIKEHFAAVFQGIGADRLELHVMFGEEWNVAKAREYLQNMKIEANDVIVFYQSGHGAIGNAQQPAATHRIQLSSRAFITRGEVVQLLRQHRSRGVILLTDCCSSIIGGLSRDNGDVRAQQIRINLNAETMRNLFLRFQGFVDITAADVGTTASANNDLGNFGGAHSAFTVAFLKLAADNQSFANWQTFFVALKDMTRTASHNQHQAYAFQIAEGDMPTQTVYGDVPTAPATTTAPVTQVSSTWSVRPERIRD